MEQLNNYFTKKRIIIIITVLLILVMGFSLAFFAPRFMDPTGTEYDLTTSTTDKLLFEVSDDINIGINQNNLKPGGNNLTDFVDAKATLLANNSLKTATYTYNVYLLINKNEFVYTTPDLQPEIILTVKDPTNKEVTSIAGLTYNETLKGFDITCSNGLIKIASNHSITANNTTPTEQIWNITLSFINLNSDQQENTGKTLNANVLIQKDEIKFFADYLKETVSTDSSLFYHDSSLTNGAGDLSYRYSGPNPNNYVCFGTDVTPCPDDFLYRIIGVFGDNVKLIKYDYSTSALLGSNGAAASSYSAMWGTQPTSYKGSNYANLASYYWNSTAANKWEESSLNLINLNKNFLDNIGTKWVEKITTSTWQVGGNYNASLVVATPSVSYSNEIISPTEDIKYDAKIGLMYLSDYGFAASQSSWTTGLNIYNTVVANNWMYMGLLEWTITHRWDNTDFSIYVRTSGELNGNSVRRNYAIRPVFSLLSTVEHSSGTGTYSDPYIIKFY